MANISREQIVSQHEGADTSVKPGHWGPPVLFLVSSLQPALMATQLLLILFLNCPCALGLSQHLTWSRLSRKVHTVGFSTWLNGRRHLLGQSPMGGNLWTEAKNHRRGGGGRSCHPCPSIPLRGRPHHLTAAPWEDNSGSSLGCWIRFFCLCLSVHMWHTFVWKSEDNVKCPPGLLLITPEI